MGKTKEEKEVEEAPKIEEPTETTEQSQEDVSALIAELEKAGVSTPEELSGKLAASKEAGRLANMVGDLKRDLAKRDADLETLIRNQQRTTEDFSGEGSTLELENLIVKAIEKHDNAKTQKIVQAQRQNAMIWDAIQNDKNYGIVKEVWEAKTSNPAFMSKVNAGLVNPYQEYNDTVVEYYKGITRRTLDALKQVHGGQPGPAAPHVEGGEGARLPGPESPTEDKDNEEIASLQEKVNKGQMLTEEDELRAIELQMQGLQGGLGQPKK